MQVHKEKKFKCASCNKSFLTEKDKYNHCNNECGVKFSCLSCNAMYNTQVALGAHCKRKHHLNVKYGKQNKNSKCVSSYSCDESAHKWCCVEVACAQRNTSCLSILLNCLCEYWDPIARLECISRKCN